MKDWDLLDINEYDPSDAIKAKALADEKKNIQRSEAVQASLKRVMTDITGQIADLQASTGLLRDIEKSILAAENRMRELSEDILHENDRMREWWVAERERVEHIMVMMMSMGFEVDLGKALDGPPKK